MSPEPGSIAPEDFDVRALFAALEARRLAQGLSWRAVTQSIWDQSHVLNAQRGDHPISPETLRKLDARPQLSCQHALFVLRWLEAAPEAFIAAPRPGTLASLPAADAAHRQRWSLRRLHGALDAARMARGASWRQVAERLGCTPSQLTGLRTARFATGLTLAMRITQALRRPAADFIYPADW